MFKFKVVEFDKYILEKMEKSYSKAITILMFGFTYLGSAGAWIVHCSLFFILGYFELWKLSTVSALITTAFVQIIKRIVKRKRPNGALNSKGHDQFSFPSGHTASSFAVAGSFISEAFYFICIYLLLATAIAISRVYLRAHYFSDVLVGSILGFLTGLLIRFIIF